jgi:hypothetical protein
MIDPMTGEIILTNDMDMMLSYIQQAEKTIAMIRASMQQVKDAIYQHAQFNGSKTARVQGEKYKCKIEMPTKIVWDQKKLSHIYSVYPHGTIVDSVVKIASYKVDTREYKKIINTVGNEDFNKFKDELVAANLGTMGTPRFTIE